VDELAFRSCIDLRLARWAGPPILQPPHGASIIETMAAIDYHKVFKATPTPCLLLNIAFQIIAASQAYLLAVHREQDDLIGKNMFVAFPDNPEDPHATGVSNLRNSLNNVLANRVSDTMAVQKYDISCTLEDGTPGFEERFWSPVNSPILADNGTVLYILHRVVDVTEFMTLQKRDAQLTQMTDQLRDRLRSSKMDIVMRCAPSSSPM
jgi:PAS domain-containing protein